MLHALLSPPALPASHARLPRQPLPRRHHCQVRIPPTGARLVIASDGLWDAVPAGRVARVLRQHGTAKGAAMQAISSVAASRGGLLSDDATGGFTKVAGWLGSGAGCAACGAGCLWGWLLVAGAQAGSLGTGHACLPSCEALPPHQLTTLLATPALPKQWWLWTCCLQA